MKRLPCNSLFIEGQCFTKAVKHHDFATAVLHKDNGLRYIKHDEVPFTSQIVCPFCQRL